MVSQSIKLGGTAAGISVGRVAHGLMMMTWRPNPASGPVSDEQAFEAIKAGVDALPAGTKMFLNSAEFYDNNWGPTNLQLLNRFFTKYPKYADRTFLSVKGGMRGKPPHITPDASLDYLRSSIDNILKELGPNKKVDLFEPARIDRNLPIETIMNNLVTLLEEGKFSHIGLSECNATTLRKAHAVYPVTAAEIEVSAWEYGENQKAVIAAGTELNISVLAYSPLGQGFLTGQFKSAADIPQGDARAGLDRFQEQNLRANVGIVEGLTSIADKKGVPASQLCIAWVASLGPTVIPLPGSSKASRTLENLQGGEVKLTEEELNAIGSVLAANPVAGDRYWGKHVDLHLWG
ncbi:aldo/keto reductase [Rhodocollybia butyracea]|uniref:Aldo/keto reductase n=1 Tax=Rhodocollybia butyracea TaxID=206335 RepID=A0A9P5Q421_9AGAR|nr:aldo/keto reductase [Rhodocollybia butyracea]